MHPEFQPDNIDNLKSSSAKTLRSEFEHMEEQKIWDQFISGNQAAFIFIYDKYFTILFRYGSQFTFDKNIIKDAIQDLFFELINKRKKLSRTTSIKFYLLKSLKRALIHLIKKGQKFNFQENLPGNDFLITTSVEHKIINRQLHEEKLLQITEAMKTLTRKQREIIYYFYFENLTIDEIARLMNFSNVKSTQNLLYKSLQLLKTKVMVVSIVLWFLLVNTKGSPVLSI